MKKSIRFSMALLLIALLPFTSCKKEDPEPEVIASFTFTVDASDYKKVQFTNESQNYSALSWNFGDNSAASTEANPVHTFAAVGEYNVTLTATSMKGGTTDVFSQKVTIADPNVMLTKLAGESSKTWKLIRDVSTKRYPLEVGPESFAEIWWAMGRNNDELALRPCMLNDEWTFHRDGRMIFDAKGDIFAEGNIFEPGWVCTPETNMFGPGGVDLRAWGSGNHTFELTTGETPKLKVIGNGAYVGFYKLGNGTEVTTPQASVQYNIRKLHDGPVDTLIVEGIYRWNPAEPGGYWRFVLVHYDNPADEPPIPANQPNAAFNFTISGKTVVFNNTSTFATSYLWNFGDGNTSTATSPTHTYADEGLYTVSLTATNNIGTKTASADLVVSTTALTTELLVGAPWKVRVEERSVFVGPGLGDASWWALPKAFLDGSSSGGDDWSCMPDDEFTFHADGKFTYDTKGSARNDGYFGSPNGCISDAEIAASGNGAAFGSALGDNAHTFAFTPATADSRAIITLTNGPGRAAFIGFYKGYYGGENANIASPPNGGSATNRYEVIGYAKSATKEYLIVSVDISASTNGSAAWTMVMER